MMGLAVECRLRGTEWEVIHGGLWGFYSHAGYFSFKIISVSSRDMKGQQGPYLGHRCYLKLLLLIPVSYLCSVVKYHKVWCVCMCACGGAQQEPYPEL